MSNLVAIITKAIDLVYVKPLRKVFSQQVFRYLACGATTALLDAVWYYIIYHYIVCEEFLDLGFVVMSPHIAALCVVFPITFFTGFWLNRNVVFDVAQFAPSGQLVRYALSVVGSVVVNYLCIKLFVEVCHIWPTPAKALTTVVSVMYSYIASRYFAFGEKRISR